MIQLRCEFSAGVEGIKFDFQFSRGQVAIGASRTVFGLTACQKPCESLS